MSDDWRISVSGPRLVLELQPRVLRWARLRAGLEVDEIARKVGVSVQRVIEWEESGKISFAQVGKLAHHTHTPLGYLYLSEPPQERLPIPDFRTAHGRPVRRPSPELLETVHAMQRRVAWMREELIDEGVDPLPFVGAWPVGSAPERVASEMRAILGLETGWAARQSSWADALRFLRERIEDAGVMVVFNGVVNNNTRRKLDPDEFRGFAIVDEYAPLVFVNGRDFVSAQIFTLAHELAHVFAGASGVSDVDLFEPSSDKTEQFCNAVAAEFLAPEDEFRSVWASASGDRFQLCARHFKVSVLVAARRALEIRLIEPETFRDVYRRYEQLQGQLERRKSGGGHFWHTQNARIGKRFGSAVARAVREGRLLYREAYLLTGLSGETFNKFVERMGVHV